ncbi:dsDNA nuclease domain-containing protein [Photobacterium sp. GB-3]|uniref:dsDNA nuclease domain-containing protein n=1 Tax=Photobacterium sp. GB-3 TaxID=2022110 RepID=UPI000D152419|nr:dsDNA nuclease domain-containing protein [Photobacterium sp. GB-3]PSV57114.1 hypothetical protein C9J43_08025 [Photobacterium sp. GB-3]
MAELQNDQQIDANSGVEALLGFEFQRNCALLLLLENYKDYSDKNFFLSIEHYDDFLFCFRDKTTHKIEYIKSYQAKKNSGHKWSINDLAIPTAKMLDVGKAILNDSILKSEDFKSDLIFISNKIIELKSDNLNKEHKSKKAQYITITLKENNNYVSYKELNDVIKVKIRNSIPSSFIDSEFDNLFYQWIDFPVTPKNQIAIIDDRVRENFEGIPDSKAAIQALLTLFKNIETVYNNKNKISLLDKSKILEGSEISKAMNLIDLEQRAFNFWRDSAKQFCPKLKINTSISNKAEEYIGIAFELFKDKSQVEHKKIYDFVKNSNFDNFTFTDEDCIDSFVSNYYSSSITSNSLSHEDIVFAIICAYVQTRDIK